MEFVTYPDPRLRKKCSPITEIDDETLNRAEEMLELMYAREGVGLAGPQVGWLERIVTVDIEGNREGDRIFVNPKIIESEGSVKDEEGCLSLPGIWVPITRAERVVVSAYTIRGKKVEMEAEGTAARAWQQEIDHLNGMLIIDRTTPTAIMQVRRKLKKLEREYEEKHQEEPA